MTTSTATNPADTMSEAAGLILAEVAGDDDAAQIMLTTLLDARDLGGTLRLLRAVLSAAGLAVRKEAVSATEAGEDSTPSVDFLVALQGHARTSAEADQ